MPLTSLYLCGRTVQAAVGRTTRRGARFSAFHRGSLPAGCLVNSVPVDEEALTAFLRGFFLRNRLPARRVALVLSDAAFRYSRLTLPVLHGRARQRILQRELASENAADTLLTDTMPLYAGPAGEALLVTRMDQGLVGRWIELCRAAGLHPVCLDGVLPCLIQAVRRMPALRTGDCLLLWADPGGFALLRLHGGDCAASLVERLPAGQGASMEPDEFARRLDDALFLLVSPASPRPDRLYLAGCAPERAGVCRTVCAGRDLEALPLPAAPGIALPEGMRPADALPVIGNLIAR